ncbi:hypothetical protein Poly51_54580 [Rubripirellula tenax]|uniref:Methyltransferase type 11 domain-containing protein n=1 Tax=Rubripirellula tenax TaxID=2528015 RepID=A0A5C6E8P3_9BACT|nr:class I SAM-dependent methyltransferase [Rubripirellula tenax]TWU46063.1 hypothetical protein Poly51_54580 [Rubripirellula tenax]
MPILERVRAVAGSIKFNLQVQSLPDRRYLRKTMLPAMAKACPANVLLAGTRRYTRRYPAAFDPHVTKVWTIDFDPGAERFGNGSLHHTGDMCEVDQVFQGVLFDVIHVNGLLGFGVNEPAEVCRMVEACHRALKPNGSLMLGWDVDCSPDPLDNPDVIRLFSHQQIGDLPARHRESRVNGFDHVFDWFERREISFPGLII